MPLTTTHAPDTKSKPEISKMSVARMTWIVGVCITLFTILFSYVIYKNNLDELPEGSMKWIFIGIAVGVALIAYGASAEAKEKKNMNEKFSM